MAERPRLPRVPRGPLIAGSALLAVLVAAGGVYSASASTGTPTTADYRVAAVTRGAVAQVLTLTGTAQRVNQVTASFAAGGTVTSLHAAVGDHVSAGQTLATIDPTALHANLLTAQASLAQDEASLVTDGSTSTSTTAPASTASTASTAATAARTATRSTTTKSTTTKSTTTTGTAVTSSSRSSTSSAGAAGSGSSRTSGSGGTATSAGRAAAGAPAAGGTSTTGGATPPRLSTSAVQRTFAASRRALMTEEQVCAPVLGSTAVSPTGHVSRPTSPPQPTGTPAPTTATPTATPTQTPSETATTTPAPSDTSTPSTSTPSPTLSPTPGAGGAPGPSAAAFRSCAAAMLAVSRAQHDTETAMTSLASQITRELSAIVRASVSQSSGSGAAASAGRTSAATAGPAGAAAARFGGASGSSAGTGTSASGGSSTGSRSSAGAGSSTGAGSSSGAGGAQAAASAGASTSSAARVAADDVAILQDQASVTQARAALAGATLDAPITGTVGQVSLTVGQSDGAGSVVIVGGGAVSVTVDVPVADMPLVHQGLTAEVTPAGDVKPVAGTVSAVSPLPVSSTTTTPLYPVVVTVPNPPQAMASGSSVTVAITVGEASDVMRVPVSAVAGLQTGTGTVQVLRAAGPQTQAVTVGAVGGGYAQILTGLRDGDRVVLADLTAALPSNQTVNVRGLVGGGGAGFGGAARAGGGTGGTGGTGGAGGTSNGGTGGNSPRGAG